MLIIQTMSSLYHKHILTVRFFDVDAMGHTNNASYFSYLEEARMSYFKALGYTQEKFMKECPFILAEAACQYKAPSFMGEILEIYCGAAQLKNASFIIEYEIKEQKSQKLICLAKTVQVTFDYKTGKVVPISDGLRKKIEEYENKLKHA